MGIGKAFAHEFARRGHPILMVALDDDNLISARREIEQTHSVVVDSLGVDLSCESGPRSIWDWVQSKGYSVNILVNNAGFGRNGILESKDWSEYNAMIQLNNRAMVQLTYLFAPMLKQHPGNAYLLNMSSMEVPLIIPYKAVYSGTKHFVFGFSLGMREELKSFGVSVTTVCPGPVVTNEDGLRRIQSQGPKARLLVLMPEQVARQSVQALFKRKQVITPGRMAYFLSHLAHWVPWRYRMPLLEKMFRRYKET